MVGRLSLQDVPDLPESKRKGERALDSPDSGLPPSPGSWLLSGGGSERGLANGLPEEPETAAAAPATKPPPRVSAGPRGRARVAAGKGTAERTGSGRLGNAKSIEGDANWDAAAR